MSAGSQVRLDDELLVLDDESSSEEEGDSELPPIDMANAKRFVWSDDGATAVEVVAENQAAAPVSVVKDHVIKPFPYKAEAHSPVSGILPLGSSRSAAKKKSEQSRGVCVRDPEGSIITTTPSTRGWAADVHLPRCRRQAVHLVDEDKEPAAEKPSKKKRPVAHSTAISDVIGEVMHPIATVKTGAIADHCKASVALKKRERKKKRVRKKKGVAPMIDSKPVSVMTAAPAVVGSVLRYDHSADEKTEDEYVAMAVVKSATIQKPLAALKPLAAMKPLLKAAISSEVEEEEKECAVWKIHQIPNGWTAIKPKRQQQRLEEQFQKWIAGGRDAKRKHLMFRNRYTTPVCETRVTLSPMSSLRGVWIATTEPMPLEPVIFNAEKWVDCEGRFVESSRHIGRFP